MVISHKCELAFVDNAQATKEYINEYETLFFLILSD